MRRRAIASFIAACALSACAHEAPPDPSSFAGMSWGMDTDASEAKLSYGVPNSDVLWIMMSCAPRSGLVEVTQLGVEGRWLRLQSGGRILQVESQPLGEIEGISGRAPAAHPALLAFAKSGALAYGTERSMATLPPANPALVNRFLASCR